MIAHLLGPNLPSLSHRLFHLQLHVVVVLSAQVDAHLVVELGQHFLFDDDVVALLFELDVQAIFSVLLLPVPDEQAEIVIVVKLSEGLHDEVLAHLKLLILLEVGVKDEVDAPLMNQVLPQILEGPHHVDGKASDHLVELLLFLLSEAKFTSLAFLIDRL